MRQLVLLSPMFVAMAVLAGCSGGGEAEDPADKSLIGQTQYLVQPPASFTMSESFFLSLLTAEDIDRVMDAAVPLKAELHDFKDITESVVGTPQVFPMDSGYALEFATEDGESGVWLGVVDLESTTAAAGQYDLVKRQTIPAPEIMVPPIGHASAELESETGKIGSNIVFFKRDKLVTLHTTRPEGEQPLIDLEGLRTLARLVEQKLK